VLSCSFSAKEFDSIGITLAISFSMQFGCPSDVHVAGYSNTSTSDRIAIGFVIVQFDAFLF